MKDDPVDELFARIEALERFFAGLNADPASQARRGIESRLSAGTEPPAAEPRAFIRGGYGEEMDLACSAIAAYFRSLPGWRDACVDDDEVVYLAGFFAFIALASSPTAPLGRAEAATGARATVARRLMVRKQAADRFSEQLHAFKVRLNEYSSLWAGVLKGKNSFGAFAARVFENVRVGERTRDGYLEHLNGFPQFCEARISGFHAAGAASGESAAQSGAQASGRLLDDVPRG